MSTFVCDLVKNLTEIAIENTAQAMQIKDHVFFEGIIVLNRQFKIHKIAIISTRDP
jgi:hypothetical protein